jgi:hypothetical protein
MDEGMLVHDGGRYASEEGPARHPVLAGGGPRGSRLRTCFGLNLVGSHGSASRVPNPLYLQTVQFHVRDAETADEDLRESLLHARDKAPRSARPAGALLFTCNGRGTRLFDGLNHDVSLIHEILGPIPVAGFFAMGEIGPIGGQNFVHGYTASIVLFEEADRTEERGGM